MQSLKGAVAATIDPGRSAAEVEARRVARPDVGAAEPSAPADAADHEVARRDAAIALRSALALGTSLLCTWSLALLVRVLLPRWLGPDTFGAFTFADGFTATFFIVLGLGVETYIQKEIPVRPAHASDFFGGVIVLRVALAVLLLGAMSLTLTAMHRSALVHELVLVFGAGQLLLAINTSLGSLLQASRSVGGLAFVNVVAKVLWGAGVLLALFLGLGLLALAGAFAVGELLRLVVLLPLAKKHVNLKLHVDLRAVRRLVVASLPYYLNLIACTVYARVDVTMLSLLSTDREIGWYGAAANFAALALLASPLVAWVLMPMMSRAVARSEEELYRLVRRAIEAALLVALPLSLVTGLGADVWVHVVFGKAFGPAVLSLRVLSPVFLFTYVAMLAATALVMLGRPWRVAALSMVGLVINPALDLLLVRWSSRTFGPGGAGAGAAIALLVTEAFVAVAMVATVGRRAFDRRSVRAILAALGASVAVVALDRLLVSIGPARLLVDLCAWLAMAVALGAVRPSTLPLVLRALRSARSVGAPPAVLAAASAPADRPMQEDANEISVRSPR
jgi:O-antigen/teichoic acid export membrane protein